MQMFRIAPGEGAQDIRSTFAMNDNTNTSERKVMLNVDYLSLSFVVKTM